MNIKFSVDDLKIFIWPALGILITLILLISVIIPQIISIIDTNSKIEEQKVQTANLKNKAAILESINLNQYKEDFNTLSVALPLGPDIPSAVSQLQILASDSNVTINSFAVSLPSSATADNFQIRIDLEGELGNINDFVKGLKSSSRIFVLNRLEFVGSRSSSTYQASVSLFAYFQPVLTTLSEIDQEIQPLSSQDQAEVVNINKNVSQNPGVSEFTTTGPRGKSNPFE